jgi:hypothetical protein
MEYILSNLIYVMLGFIGEGSHCNENFTCSLVTYIYGNLEQETNYHQSISSYT